MYHCRRGQVGRWSALSVGPGSATPEVKVAQEEWGGTLAYLSLFNQSTDANCRGRPQAFILLSVTLWTQVELKLCSQGRVYKPCEALIFTVVKYELYTLFHHFKNPLMKICN